MISKSMAKKIKIRLIKLNLTQQQVANDLGVSKQQLNNVINGIVENLPLEEKLKKYLQVNKKVVK